MKRTLWEGTLSNSVTGDENAITLSDSVNNYDELEVEIGLNNWGRTNGLSRVRLSPSCYDSPVSIVYFTTDGAQISRGGALRIINNGRGIAWTPDRSFSQASYLEEEVVKLKNTLPTTSEDGINLYRVVGIVK